MKNLLVILIVPLVFLISACGVAEQNLEDVKPLNVNHPLKACPDSPNCINTEYPEKTTQYLPPLIYEVKADAAKPAQIMAKAKQIILDMGGKIIKEETDYLATIFTSSIFRFVDDFEIRNDVLNHTLHVRSASRTGYSDFGVNKRRVKVFLKGF